MWVQSQNTDRRLPAIVLGFGTSITQSTGTPAAFILEEEGRRIQQIHGYKECFSIEHTWLGREVRAAVSHIVSNLWGRWGGSTEQFSRFDDVSKSRVQLSYLFILIVFSLKLQIPFSLENKTITLHERLISVFHWQTAMLFFTKFSEKTLSKNAYELCECMYLDVCMGNACITLFLSTICITIGLLRAGNLPKVLSAFSWEPQKHLLWLGIRTDSVRWENWEREKCGKGSIASRWYCWAVVMNPSAFKACVCSSSSYHVLQRELFHGTKTLWFHGNHGWLRLSR